MLNIAPLCLQHKYRAYEKAVRDHPTCVRQQMYYVQLTSATMIMKSR
jgi:hypothetical protein